jgi:hypothetical protein
MEYLDNVELISAVLVAIIGGIFSIIIEVIKVWIRDRKILIPRFNPLVVLVYLLIGGAIGYSAAYLRTRDAGKLPEAIESISVQAKTVPTPIYYGDLVMSFNFDQKGDGLCNDYDASKLGYEGNQYYIHPSKSNGFIAVCHEDDGLNPQGSIQVLAYPEGNSAYFGYGVLFGWKGGGVSTTDACMLGIRKSGGRTEAVFVDWVDGNYQSSTLKLGEVLLDEEPHSLRVVLQSNGSVQGYIDGVFFAEHQFIHCSKGPIGMVAWSSGQKIYFDDLKYYEVP